MLVNVGFVEPTYLPTYVIFNFMLLEHYLLQFYLSFYTSVN